MLTLSENIVSVEQPTTLQQRVRIYTDAMATGKFTGTGDNDIAAELAINNLLQHLQQLRVDRKRLFVIGNGGSAAVASHIVNDFCNTGKLIASTLHEPAVATCFANDFGYEQIYARQLECQWNDGDMLVAISSSGNSANIVNAVKVVQSKGGYCFTLSGFHPNNSLRQLGQLNYWLDSNQYGVVEIAHLFILHHLADRLYQC